MPVGEQMTFWTHIATDSPSPSETPKASDIVAHAEHPGAASVSFVAANAAIGGNAVRDSGRDCTDWSGVCACGKAAMDGIRCALGATHEHR